MELQPHAHSENASSINTEAGIYVKSEALAQQVIEYMDEGVSPHNAYRVMLDDAGGLHWRIETADMQLDFGVEPDSRCYQRYIFCVSGFFA